MPKIFGASRRGGFIIFSRDPNLQSGVLFFSDEIQIFKTGSFCGGGVNSICSVPSQILGIPLSWVYPLFSKNLGYTPLTLGGIPIYGYVLYPVCTFVSLMNSIPNALEFSLPFSTLLSSKIRRKLPSVEKQQFQNFCKT